MITTHVSEDSTWIELDHPTDEDILEIVEKYDINPEVARDLKEPSLKQRVEPYDHYLYLILHFPAFKHSHGEENIQEIDFLVGRDFVITVKYDTIDSLHAFSKVVEVQKILGKSKLHEQPEFIFFGILREIYKSLVDEISLIEDKISDIESKVFKEREREMVFALSSVSRNLLDLKRTIEQHKEVLDTLEIYGEEIFGPDFAHNVTVIRNDYFKVRNLVRSNVELAHELRETNNSLLTTKQNEVMKIFTIMAFVTFPLSLLLDIFNMASQSTPLGGHPHSFLIVLGSIIVAAGIMFGFFRYKRWL